MAGGRETRGGAASAARAAGTEVVVRSCGAPRASRRIADVRGSCRRTAPRNSDDGGVEANDTTPASPSSTNLTTAVSGRRLAGALVLGPGVSSWQTRRLNSLNSAKKMFFVPPERNTGAGGGVPTWRNTGVQSVPTPKKF